MLDLMKINTATKYPSIPTYHQLGDRGMLRDLLEVSFNDMVVWTEKVDGTNGRIILLPGGDYLIGSREHLLAAKGDRVPNPAQSIVPTLHDLAERLVRDDDMITTFYLEVYGGKTSANAKQYTGTGALGYRLFDISMVALDTLRADVDQIAAWRERAGQAYLDEEQLVVSSRMLDIPLVPRLGAGHHSILPTGIEDTHKWLGEYLPKTNVALDDSGAGKPEGIVLRSPDRTFIAKARFEDYERTLRRRK